MLNKEERYEVVKVFKICSIIGPFPTHVDLTNWQLRSPSTRKKWICVLSFVLFVLNVLFKIGSLAFALLFVTNVPIHKLLIHTIIVMAISTSIFWYYTLYVRNPSQFAAFFRMTLLGNVGGSLGPEEQMKKDWKLRLRECSMQDLIATSLPYAAPLAVPTIIAGYMYDPSMRLLVYAALPNNLQNWATFGLCMLDELWLLMFTTAIVVPIGQLQVISFEHVSNQLERLIRKIQNGKHSVRKVYRILCTLRLYVSILNNVNSYVTYTWKLLSISLCILNGYVAVAHFREHPVFGVMAYVILFDVAMTYMFIYEKAFKIPQLFNKAAACAILHMNGKRCGICKRQILSVLPAGIKVGDFHTMERESTLIFIDFVLTNIVSMLVAYR